MSVQTQNLRPVIWPLLNPDTGFIGRHTLCPDAGGHYSRQEIRRLLDGAAAIRRQVFLSFKPPAVGYREQEILSLGKDFGREPRICGIDPGAAAEQPVEAKHILSLFRRAFPRTRLFVPTGVETGPYGNTGLLLQPNEILANESQAEKTCLAISVDPEDMELVCFAAIHHVAILLCSEVEKANRPCHAGHRFRSGQLTMDDADKAIGTVRFIVSLINDGTAPCYGDAAFLLRLCGSGIDDERVYPLGLRAADLLPGEEKIVHLAANVAGLAQGDYDVQIGLFFTDTGDCCSFGMEGRISDGYYEGRLILTL